MAHFKGETPNGSFRPIHIPTRSLSIGVTAILGHFSDRLEKSFLKETVCFSTIRGENSRNYHPMQILRLWTILYCRSKIIFVTIRWMASFTMGLSRTKNGHSSQEKKKIVGQFIFIFCTMGKAFINVIDFGVYPGKWILIHLRGITYFWAVLWSSFQNEVWSTLKFFEKWTFLHFRTIAYGP